MKIINLTPHALNIHTDDGVIELPPSGTVARVSVEAKQTGWIGVDGGAVIRAYHNEYGQVTGLPAPEEGVGYVVSGMVLEAVRGQKRTDVFAPGELIRDEVGRPVGCQGLRW